MAIGDGANTIRAEELALFRHKAAVLSQNKRGVKTGSVNATQEKCSSRYQESDWDLHTVYSRPAAAIKKFSYRL